MLVEDLVAGKNTLTILGLVVVLILLSACGQSPTPVTDEEIPTVNVDGSRENTPGIVDGVDSFWAQGHGVFSVQRLEPGYSE